MRQAIINNGWRQGSLIALDKIKTHIESKKDLEEATFLPISGEIDKQESIFLVAINMSCDVIFGNVEALPEVKFLVCRVKRGRAQNKKIADPRKMVLQYGDNTLSFEMKDRAFIHRSVLSTIEPDGALSEEQVNSLVRWKIAQFNRLGLPEDLVEFVGDALRDKDFLGWVREIAPRIEGIFLEVRRVTEVELPEEYEFGVLVVADSCKVESLDIYDMDEKLQKLLLEPLRVKNNIRLLNDYDYQQEGLESVISSSEFTYDMLKRFRRYYLDQYSLDPGTNSSPIGV